MSQCAATSKQSGERCKKDAISGKKVCHIHGGKSPGAPIKHGQYSRYASEKLKEKIEVFKEADPLDLTNELALTRALLAEYLSRFDTAPLGGIDISIMSDLIDRINKTVATIVKIKNDSALTAAEVIYLATRCAEIVKRYIHDPTDQQAFIQDLFGGVSSASPAIPDEITIEFD